MVTDEINEFAKVLIFLIGGALFVIGGLVATSFVRPHRPDEEKMTSYECGEEKIGSSWGNFNLRFYVIAIIFLLFDVEIVFLMPWATIFGNVQLIKSTNGAWAWVSIIEAFVFVFILLLGLIYAWAKGYLNWIRPKMQAGEYESVVPKSLYDTINDKYAKK